ncbi:phosphoenolpyruvate carboxykinase (ATP) [Olsenella sp. YH-ols2217]|uniref:Phosphoenolpyruvate carboxykinase (ATP) n=1 Tax=Kribbibacterium absianum TaxID=3044210 RepID=A0ABT6ZLV2_9ACTN|nr:MULTISPECIES: phosphoenolpyruvate carboxykinase (ATP) [unclassified Olsenella]MDJ1122035.1 phosphoenolpyruvate carboxykinase (ATP) [Olsenella sp. YH-ols2216]MDJ1130043.1 phosphoenolpyruvate carboxykinase (ATP) [Olsenella sp. YH-ols2217]
MFDERLVSVGVRVQEEDVHWDLSVTQLIEEALIRHEGELASNGSLVVKTGDRTGRSPNDRFIVDTPDVHDKIAWGSVNRPMDEEHYRRIKRGICERLSEQDPFVIRGLAGARRPHSRKFMVVCEEAHQALFAKQMLVRPNRFELWRYGDPDFTVLACPSFTCDPTAHGTNSEAAVVINFAERVILVAGTGYSGEIKKSIFSAMNYLLPVEDDVLTMHCSANVDTTTGSGAVFFGLSGTGKTTLSADPRRQLIGDDEHAWCREGVFNLEGGCYAKTIGLTRVREPEIFGAIRFGALCENVVLNPQTRKPDYEDSSITENTRVSYPVEFIPNALLTGVAGIPDVVIFLTADAFGVLPPVARLTPEGAKYQFLTGFTSKVAGTEEGIVEPQPTFSSMFGEPFMPLRPEVYARKLGEKIGRHGVRCYLINTGWTGGPYGTGHRIDLGATRAIVDAVLEGSIEDSTFVHNDLFNFDVPLTCPGVEPGILDPKSTWVDGCAYDRTALELALMFQENWEKRFPGLTDIAEAGGPKVPSTATEAEPQGDLDSLKDQD